MHNKYEYLEKLLKLGAKPNNLARYWSPLYEAVMRKDKKPIELLLKYGADASLGSIKGTTPLELANNDESKDIDKVLALEMATNILKRAYQSKINPPLRTIYSRIATILIRHLPIKLANIVISYIKTEIRVSAGKSHTCAVKVDGKIAWCDSNFKGQSLLPDKFIKAQSTAEPY